MKKLKNTWILFLLLAFVVLMLCSSCQRAEKSEAPALGNYAETGARDQGAPSASLSQPAAKQKAASEPEMEERPEADKQGSQSNLLQDRKIIRTANLTIYVDNFEKGAETITTVTNQFGGVVANSQLSRYSNSVSGNLTLWIPAEKLVPCVEELKKVGRVTNASVTADDISAEYFDLEARLNNAKRKEARLQEMYAKASKIEDLLAVENELSATREEIERLEGQKRMWDKQVSYSTVTVNLIQDIEIVQEPDDVWKPLRRAIREIRPTFLESVKSFGGCIGGLLLLVIALIPWLIVIIPLFFLWKKFITPRWHAFLAKRREARQKNQYGKKTDTSESSEKQPSPPAE